MKKLKNEFIFLKKNIKFNVFLPMKGEIKCLFKQDNIKKNTKKAFIFQTPTHGNLGDQAIAYAQEQFVKKHLPNYDIIEVPYNQVYLKAPLIKRYIQKDDIIFIHGGGNMGDMYDYEEYARRYIISYFKKYNVVSFPQTICFSNNDIGVKQLKASIKNYSENRNLLLVAREEKSEKIMKEVFVNNKVVLTPDIVLSLTKKTNKTRNGIVTCLRNDIEGVIDNNLKEQFINKLLKEFENVSTTDTIINETVTSNNRKEELDKIWNIIQTAEVVITDRLHGMIFCAITGTPCIVFKNFNHKIEYSYLKWLKNLKHIKLMKLDNQDLIIEEINKMKNMNIENVQLPNLDNEYLPLVDYLKKISNYS